MMGDPSLASVVLIVALISAVVSAASLVALIFLSRRRKVNREAKRLLDQVQERTLQAKEATSALSALSGKIDPTDDLEHLIATLDKIKVLVDAEEKKFDDDMRLNEQMLMLAKSLPKSDRERIEEVVRENNESRLRGRETRRSFFATIDRFEAALRK